MLPIPEPETMKNNDEQTSQKQICQCCTTLSWTTGLGCGLAVLVLPPPHLAWALPGLGLSPPLSVSCTDSPALLWAQLCCRLELCSSLGKWKDGQQWEKDGVCRAGPGNFPSEENGIKWCSGATSRVCSPFLPPEAMPQGWVGGIEYQYSHTHTVLGCAPSWHLPAKLGQVVYHTWSGINLGKPKWVFLYFQYSPVMLAYSKVALFPHVFVPPEQYWLGKKIIFF